MSTLAQLEARVAARLTDASNAVFSAATIDEALRAALSDYTAVAPCTAETVITTPGAGREIALAGIANLIGVTQVWWPYDTLTEVWPPNQVLGFRLLWDLGQPLLFLSATTGDQPQAADEIRVWYTVPHTIQNLDSASFTSVLPHHESGLVTGAAAYAALSENVDQIGAIHIDPTESAELRQWGAARLQQFQAFLDQVRRGMATPGPAFSGGWALDDYDDTSR